MLFGSRLATLGFAAIVVALAVAYGTFLVAPAAGIFHDDGVYLVTAKALAEGSGYRIVSLPWEPAQTKYPILFPFLLSLVWRVFPVFPENLPLLRLVPLGFGVIWLALSYRLLRTVGESRDRALLGLAVVAVSPWVVFVTTATLAETLFSALMVAGIVLLVRIDAGDFRRLEPLAAAVLMSAAMLTRAAGVAPALAGFLVLILRRRWRPAAEYACGVVIVYLPWLLWVASRPPSSAIDTFYEGSIYASYNVVTDYAWSDKLTVVGLNAIHLASIGEFWGLAAGSAAGVAVGLVGTALILRGLWSVRTHPIALIVVVYLGMLLLFVWPPFRYVVPIMPLLLWLAIKGAGARMPIAAGLALLLFVSGSWALTNTTLAVRQKGGTWYNASRVNDWRAMRAQYHWIARETPKDSVIAGVHDPTYFLFTGRKALRPFSFRPILMLYNVRRSPENPLGTADDLRHRLIAMKADYLVLTPRDGVERLANELLALVPGSLSPAFGNDPSGHLIYRVNRTVLSNRTSEEMGSARRSTP